MKTEYIFHSQKNEDLIIIKINIKEKNEELRDITAWNNLACLLRIGEDKAKEDFYLSECFAEQEIKSIFEIKFNTNVDSEELRECIEDNLGVEILEINEK
jgi:hypothetical protein